MDVTKNDQELAGSRGFERTTCDCDLCRVPCRHMPGALAPGDLEAIAEHLGVTMSGPWVEEHFRASDGAKVLSSSGSVVSIPSMVPAQQEDGSCVFLDDAGHCKVHPVAPFGCAYLDMHMGEEEADNRSRTLIMLQLGDIASDGAYSKCIGVLKGKGCVAPPLVERRENFHQELGEVEMRMQQSEDLTT